MKYYLRAGWMLLSSGSALFLIVITLVFFLVKVESSRFIQEEIQNLSHAHTAIVLGAMVKENGTLSLPLKDRVDTAITLYKAGKVDRILVSGDDGSVDYNEVNPSRDYLLEKGLFEAIRRPQIAPESDLSTSKIDLPVEPSTGKAPGKEGPKT